MPLDTTDLTDTQYAGEALVGYGGQFLVGDGSSPETFEAVAEVTSITPGASRKNVIDVTHLRSPNNHKEKIGGMNDTEAFMVEMNYRPDHVSHSYAGGGSGSFASGGLRQMYETGEVKNFKIRLAQAGSPDDGLEITVRGFISEYTVGQISAENPVKLTVAITPKQAPSYPS